MRSLAIMAMVGRHNFGFFTAEIPNGWTVGSDPKEPWITAVFPPDSDAYIQISTYVAEPNALPTSAETLAFAMRSLTDLGGTESTIRRTSYGLALSPEHSPQQAGGEVALLEWPGHIVFATFYHGPEHAALVPQVEELLGSLKRVEQSA